MKRGKDDEKLMEPMFPRLNVNDKEKGGPRAPPRNKMALYEQLSIPSQRFRPPASSSQGNEQETGMFLPVQVPPSRNPMEKPPNRYLDPNAPSAQFRRKEKSGEDDLTVPMFVSSEVGQDRGKYHNHVNRENFSPSSPASSNYSTKLQSAANNNPKQISNMGVNVRQKEKSQNTQSLNEAGGHMKQSEMLFPLERRNDPSKNFSRLQKVDSRLQPEQRVNSQSSGRRGHILVTQSTDINHQNSSTSLRNSRFEERRNVEGVINYTESHEDRTCNKGDQEDDVSETSMVDSAREMDISPDDVVGIIGQKHFWKARRAIVNQQRVFAVQVFELHRLMKVQRLIAESPHLLMEDNAFLGKPMKPPSVKKLPLEYILKAPSNVSKHKSEKPNNNMECSAENTVGKASLSTVQNGSQPQPLHYGAFTGNTTSPPVASDPNMGAWGFNQPQGHQWLVPVMSPSEGLVYKPYPGPGFTSPGFGGCGPPESTPMMGNFFNQQYQGMGLPTFVPPAGPHGYFPPYGMPVTNPAMSGHAVEETSQFTSQGLQRQLSGAGANFSVQRQNSSNLPAQKGRANPNPLKLNVCKDSEVQASTASGPSERARGALDSNVAGSNVLPLFPTSPVTEVPGGSPRCQEGDQTSQVIRVVPRNGRSATEFAARLFLSIQEERQQYDLV